MVARNAIQLSTQHDLALTSLIVESSPRQVKPMFTITPASAEARRPRAARSRSEAKPGFAALLGTRPNALAICALALLAPSAHELGWPGRVR